jgi:hypothetical protein
MGCVALLPISQASAASLKVTPLQYRTTLTSGEKKKGFVDISNPGAESLTVNFEVQAFRQIDDQGGIEFYDDADVSKGILLDLDSVELGPHEVLRLMFLIDGNKLPHGEAFAAILANTVPDTAKGIAQAVRVGTILEITNGKAGDHKGSVTTFSAPFIQVGEEISATFTIRNDDGAGQTGGFRPTVAVDVRPYSSSSVEGPLVFVGRSRTVSYRAPGNYFGFVWLQASASDSSKGQFAFVATGYWRWLGPLMIVALGGLITMGIYTTRKKH